MKIHIVQKGDTLWKIAQKYGVQFEELKKNNTQLSNPDMIMPGMKIKVPGTGSGKQAQMMQSNTKINMGTKKEAPIPGVTVPPVKEMPKQEIVSPVPKPQGPIVMKEQPKMSKEQPMPIPQPIPQPAPTIPAMPQPIIPDVDINNYYMVNMANMMVQKPQQVQPQPQPQLQPQPAVVEIESAECEESPVHVQPYPVMQDACVPITPVMPGPGFCPPVYHMYPQMYGPGPVQIQPLQQYHLEEDSSVCETQMPSWHYGDYMPVMHQQHMMPMHGGMPYNPGFVYAQHSFVSPHGHHHHHESTSHYVSESSSHVIQPTYVQPAMEMQAPYQQTANVPVIEEEEDCGCGGPDVSALMDKDAHIQPQFSQPQMQSWDQSHKIEGHSSMNDSQVSGSQASMYQSQMSGDQASMYQPQMSGGQASMYQQPQMSGGQASMYQQPQMSGGQASMYQQPQMSGSQASMYQPQMSGSQASMYQQPQMSGSQADMTQAQMSGNQTSMYQPQMSGSQASMYHSQMSGSQPVQYQMPMQPWQQQQGMFQPQMNPNQSGSFMPQMRVNHPFYPMGNVPFYGQDENVSDIGQLKNYSEAFDLPRFADESNE